MTARLARTPSPTIPGISDSVRITSGDLVLVSGQIGTDASGRVPADFAEELDACFRNLVTALTAAGAGVESTARITIYVTDLRTRSLATIREVRDRYFTEEHAPASALIGVDALALPEIRVEIDAIAVADPSGNPAGQRPSSG